jgi:hypothetical protein
MMVWETPKFYSCIVMSQQYEKKIPCLCIQYMGFIVRYIHLHFFKDKKQFSFCQPENQNGDDGTRQILFKINEKCWEKAKLYSKVLI